MEESSTIPLKSWKQFMKRWLIILGVVYLGIVAMLAFFESSLIYPAPRKQAGDAAIHGAEDVRFQSADGTRLHGWYFENKSTNHDKNKPDAKRTLVFFHGNAESVATSGTWLCGLARQLDVNAFIFDYRGYGGSEGKPYQKGIVADGTAAVEWVTKRTGCHESDLIFLGRSIGGGIAVQVAAKHEPAAMILVSTFPSLVEIAADKFKWIPVRLVLRNRYESLPIISELNMPLLQIHGDQDRMIPIDLAKKLFDQSGSVKKSWEVAPNQGHNDLNLESFHKTIKEMIAGLD